MAVATGVGTSAEVVGGGAVVSGATAGGGESAPQAVSATRARPAASAADVRRMGMPPAREAIAQSSSGWRTFDPGSARQPVRSGGAKAQEYARRMSLARLLL